MTLKHKFLFKEKECLFKFNRKINTILSTLYNKFINFQIKHKYPYI